MKTLRIPLLLIPMLCLFSMASLGLELTQGWNLISSKEGTGTAVADYFAASNFSTNSQPFNRVWGWNADNQNWEVYTTVSNDTVPTLLGTDPLSTIEAGKGYWIDITEAVTFNYSASSTFSVSTPFNMASILTQTISLTPSSKTSISSKDRVLIKYNDSYLGTNSSHGLELDGSLTNYDELLLKTFYLVQESSESCYRLDSEKHSVYSLDYNSTTMALLLRNSWGYDRDANSGYLCFTFDTANDTMAASKRFVFNTSTNTFDEDNSFTASSISYDSSNSYFVLGNSTSNLALYDSGFNFSLPSDFNPGNSELVSNSRVMWTSSGTQSYSDNNLSGDKTYKDTHVTYQSQVATAGNDTATATAAEAMLTQIKTDLESAGAALRYDTSVYLAFRDGLLNTKLKGATIVNGVIDQNTAPYVFFTNELDDSNVRHPFMVVQTYSISDKPNRLLDVPVPPGDGTTGSYETQNVTRDALLQTYTLKIPLKDYGNVSTFSENTMQNTLASDVNETNYTIYNYASISYLGVAVDGVMIYPVLNNVLVSAQKKAEVTNMGIHVGRGMGLHWHADGHGATGNGLNLYNLADYVGKSHPPLIGFGMDGIALYGKYESAHSSMNGYSEALDSFGGHDHGSYGYHYHAHSASSSVINDATSYTLHILMKGAWKGSINNIPEFWAEASQQNRYIGHKDHVN